MAHLWSNFRVNQNIHHIPCSHSTFKKVIHSDFFVLLSWVRTGFDFWFSAINILKRPNQNRNFICKARGLHMFSTTEYKLYQAEISWYLPVKKKIQQRTNNSTFWHFINTKSLKEIFSLEQYVKSHTVWEMRSVTPCRFFLARKPLAFSSLISLREVTRTPRFAS